jgi:hypothetical protein
MAGQVIRFLLHALLLIAALRVHVVSAQRLRLDQVVSRAVNRANERETARVSEVIASESYLEIQSKFHFELRLRAGPAGLSPRLGRAARRKPSVALGTAEHAAKYYRGGNWRGTRYHAGGAGSTRPVLRLPASFPDFDSGQS